MENQNQAPGAECTELQCQGHQQVLICKKTNKHWVTFDTREVKWQEAIMRIVDNLNKVEARLEVLERGDKGKRKIDEIME